MNIAKKWKRYKSIFQQIKNWPGYFLFKAGLTGSDLFTFQLKNGLCIEVPRKMLGPFRECFFDNQYHGHFPAGSIPDNPFILDIGANAGFAALNFFYVFPGATVHSFEPMPACIRQIETYQKKFPALKWVLHPTGLWSKEGTLDLFTQSADDFSTTSGILANKEGQEKITINVNTLDNFFSKFPDQEVDLMKMDCEGAEYEILFTLSDINLRKINHLVMETHRTDQYFTEDMVRFLKSKGFETDVKDTDPNGYIWAKRGS